MISASMENHRSRPSGGWGSRISIVVMAFAVSLAIAQGSPSGVGSGYGSYIGSSNGTPTLPYRDPWLDPSFVTSYVEPAQIDRWVSPGETWQIGLPIWHFGYRAYVVRDIEAYLAQFDDEITDFLEPYPAAMTGYPVDLVVDTREPVRGVRSYTMNAYNGLLQVGGAEFSHDVRSRYYYTSRWNDLDASGLVPWFWYWVDWTEEELKAYEPARTSYYGPIDGQWVPGYIPIAKLPEPTPAPTARELGIEALVGGDHEAAVVQLLEHLNSSAGDGDWAARRLLAIALVADRRTDDAAAMMRLAYLGDPNLAFDPIGGVFAGASQDGGGADEGGGMSLRLLANEAGRYANRADSASGWFLLVVILQAQGREARALELLERAEEWGLEAEIVEWMREAMGG